MSHSQEKSSGELKRGWTTGACATAAACAAYTALCGHDFPDPVAIHLPGGQTPDFNLAMHRLQTDFTEAGVIKDAGDDPDVTHGALVKAKLRRGPPGAGLRFFAGEGVGVVTRPGLPLAIGEPAINPAPRAMIAANLAALQRQLGDTNDLDIEISIPHGEAIAKKTLNGRLGIIGGLSILGTTGIVIPYSCAAWIASIHRGIDVARAGGLSHLAASTGNTSEKAIQQLYQLPQTALIEMGDFVGGLLKYIRLHPVEKLTLAGGMGKMTKLAQGMLDLHSKRGEVDCTFLADLVADSQLRQSLRAANSAKHAFELAQAQNIDLAPLVAERAWRHAAIQLKSTAIQLEVAIFDRQGLLLARTGLYPA